MPRPQVNVVVTAALPRRGSPSDTGTAMLAFSDAGATGPFTPQRVTSQAEATALYGSTTAAATFTQYVADALAQGAPSVVTLRVQAAGGAPTETEWKAGLALLAEEYGAVAQVAIPGVATAAAQAALAEHAANFTGRTVFLDAADGAAASALTTLAGTYAAATGAGRIGVPSSWITMPTAAAGTTRSLPGSVAALGLAARGDAYAGHANNAPAGDQGRGAGLVTGGIAPSKVFTAAELDSLHDAGVSAFRQVAGRPTLYGWRSVSTDARYRQLNAGRVSAQLAGGLRGIAEQFLFRQIDGQGLIYAEIEAALRGYLQPLWRAKALYGADADSAYDVVVAALNTPTSVAAGELRAAVSAALTPHTEKVTFNLTTSIAAGV